MKKKLYFKVWQSQDCVGDGYRYYIDTLDHIQELSYMFKNNEIEDIPIFEPIFMSEDEFNKLPEFSGY